MSPVDGDTTGGSFDMTGNRRVPLHSLLRQALFGGSVLPSVRFRVVAVLVAGAALAGQLSLAPGVLAVEDLDQSFGVGGLARHSFGDREFDESHAVAVQPDGKIVVAGAFGLVARLLPSGALDPSFGDSGSVTLPFKGNSEQHSVVALQGDGKIVVAGTTRGGGTDDVFALARLHPSGAPDTAFGSGGTTTTYFQGSATLRALAMQPDGKLVVAGQTWNGQGNRIAIARHAANGSLDPTFGSGGKLLTSYGGNFDTANSAVVQADGKLVFAGSRGVDRETMEFAITRLWPDGRRDTSFGSSGIVVTDFGTAREVALGAVAQPDGKLVVVGTDGYGGSPSGRFAIARYRPDGTLDPAFGTGGQIRTQFPGGDRDVATTIDLQPNGRLIVAGGSTAVRFSEYGENESTTSWAVARYDASGRLDKSFGDGDGKLVIAENVYSEVFDTALAPDGDIIFAGSSRDVGACFCADFVVGRLLPATNLLSNPSFETDELPFDGKPDGWSVHSKFTRSNEIAPGHLSYVGRFSANDNSQAATRQTVRAVAAAEYRVTCWSRIPTTSDTFSFKYEVRWINSNNNVLSTWTVQSLTDDTAGRWQRAAGDRVAPAGTVKAQLQMVAQSLNGEIYVDNCSVART